MWGENGIEIDNRDSVGGEQEVAEGKREGTKDGGEKAKHTENKKWKIIC